MSLRIYNTLTGKKEDFRPIRDGQVNMYVCGVTVYDRCHIGHARAGVVFDFVFRSLAYLGHRVTYVRNFTDVDDKIIARAAERGISCDALVDENIKAFYEDMDSLFLKRPTHEPRATQFIPQMQELIHALIAKGMAYEAEGDVFFAVDRFAEYGKLSKRNVDELESGARVAVNDAKNNPLDFALWKSAKPGEPKWPSPWGEGRPGWHIECSAMGRELLGETFDIHGGGKDLVFPHHENEIAQSQGASGKPPANWWMHNGFVNINKEKMSKSLGNFFTIRDVTAKFDPEAVRLYLLSTHYRSPIDFADAYLAEAENHLDRLYATAHRAEKLLAGETADAPGDLRQKFREALEDDFNSATAMATLNETVNAANAQCDLIERKKGDRKLLAGLHAALREMGDVLGIFNRPAAEYLLESRRKRASSAGIGEQEVETLIQKRLAARAEKNFAEADRIRNELAQKGVELKDSPTGTDWIITAK
ncbi:MAG: cysteine--tRNA ligase [Nitrospinae bacterium]|nr:cysteine--tRNA ligase [Nitrospinota bacterium]